MPEATVYSMKGRTKTVHLCVVSDKRDVRELLEQHLVVGGLTPVEANSRLADAHRTVAEVEEVNGTLIFSFQSRT